MLVEHEHDPNRGGPQAARYVRYLLAVNEAGTYLQKEKFRASKVYRPSEYIQKEYIAPRFKHIFGRYQSKTVRRKDVARTNDLGRMRNVTFEIGRQPVLGLPTNYASELSTLRSLVHAAKEELNRRELQSHDFRLEKFRPEHLSVDQIEDIVNDFDEEGEVNLPIEQLITVAAMTLAEQKAYSETIDEKNRRELAEYEARDDARKLAEKQQRIAQQQAAQQAHALQVAHELQHAPALGFEDINVKGVKQLHHFSKEYKQQEAEFKRLEAEEKEHAEMEKQREAQLKKEKLRQQVVHAQKELNKIIDHYNHLAGQEAHRYETTYKRLMSNKGPNKLSRVNKVIALDENGELNKRNIGQLQKELNVHLRKLQAEAWFKRGARLRPQKITTGFGINGDL